MFIEHAPVALAMFDREMRYIHASRPWLTDYGLGDRDLRGISHYEVFPEIPERWKQAHRRGLRGESLRHVADRFERADGMVQWVRWELVPWREAGGEVGGIVIFSQDVTAHKLAEEKASTALQGEQHLATILQAARDGILIADLCGRLVHANDVLCAMSGYTRDELLQLHIWDLDDVFSRGEICVRIRQLQQQGSALFETRHRRKDGSKLDVEVSTTYQETEGGRIVAFLRDITRRKMAEEALHQSERRLAALVSSAHDAIVSLDPDQRVILFNAGAERIFGCPASSIIGESFAQLLPEELRSSHMDAVRTFAAALTARSTRSLDSLLARRANGQSFPVEASISQAEVSRKKIFTVIMRDISEQRRIEEERRQALEELQRARDKLAEEKVYLEEEVNTFSCQDMIGQSPALKHVLEDAARVAPSAAAVLLLGETGTGKGMIAHALHRMSLRHDKSFIKLNCAAIPSGLLESELFGHEKGAFTGAVSRKLGRMELADQGTLFLDEIGEIPLDLQPKLLRVLQDHEFERLGSTRTLKVDFRLIAATNLDLLRSVQAGRFRSDLYYRLHVFPIHIPALRERRDDIPLLTEYFVRKFAVKMNKSITSIPTATMNALMAWNWPGNIRELENFIERSVILTSGPTLEAPLRELQAHSRAAADCATLESALREQILRALRESHGRLAWSRWRRGAPRPAPHHPRVKIEEAADRPRAVSIAARVRTASALLGAPHVFTSTAFAGSSLLAS
jgi:PAS domain S-box-containing protein